MQRCLISKKTINIDDNIDDVDMNSSAYINSTITIYIFNAQANMR